MGRNDARIEAAPVKKGDAPSAEDLRLIDACVDGDQQAWQELVRRYSRLVYSIPHRYGLNEETCDDVFQEVFSILVRQLPRIRNRQGLPKWFITTTHRVCHQTVRRARGQAVVDELIESSDALPLDEIAGWERRHQIQQALARLGRRCREFLLALYDGPQPPRYEHVAQRLDVPVGSIGPTRARCLKKLTELLKGADREDDR